MAAMLAGCTATDETIVTRGVVLDNRPNAVVYRDRRPTSITMRDARPKLPSTVFLRPAWSQGSNRLNAGHVSHNVKRSSL
jgi:hypothetical protein